MKYLSDNSTKRMYSRILHIPEVAANKKVRSMYDVAVTAFPLTESARTMKILIIEEYTGIFYGYEHLSF